MVWALSIVAAASAALRAAPGIEEIGPAGLLVTAWAVGACV